MKARILVAGATGFVGRALVPALVARQYGVRACSRDVEEQGRGGDEEYVRCDLLDDAAMPGLLEGVDAAYYLVHSLGRGSDYRERDKRAASIFANAAARAGLRRVVYLGGVLPRGPASEHLEGRREVGRILRAGRVPTVELRAAMIVGAGSASWQIVRDLALRLPVMVLPAWLRSRLRPIGIDDAVQALVDALDIPLPSSAHFDIPGPDTLTGKEILEHVAALEGRRLLSVSVPLLSPWLSAQWLRLVTRANFAVSRELILGLTEDLLPENERYWELTKHPPKRSFDEAARAALDEEQRLDARAGRGASVEEAVVRRVGPRLRAH
jgi:uncharacterized protein YbjT (DUF2867 family)